MRIVRLVQEYMKKQADANPDKIGLTQIEIINWFVETYNEDAEGDDVRFPSHCFEHVSSRSCQIGRLFWSTKPRNNQASEHRQ